MDMDHGLILIYTLDASLLFQPSNSWYFAYLVGSLRNEACPGAEQISKSNTTSQVGSLNRRVFYLHITIFILCEA